MYSDINSATNFYEVFHLECWVVHASSKRCNQPNSKGSFYKYLVGCWACVSLPNDRISDEKEVCGYYFFW